MSSETSDNSGSDSDSDSDSVTSGASKEETNHCSICNRYSWSTQECLICDGQFCRRCHTECVNHFDFWDEMRICSLHDVPCFRCERPICNYHKVTCANCEVRFCGTCCSETCQVCDIMFCKNCISHHTIGCFNCDNWFCSEKCCKGNEESCSCLEGPKQEIKMLLLCLERKGIRKPPTDILKHELLPYLL
jgi:hypothetical protein